MQAQPASDLSDDIANSVQLALLSPKWFCDNVLRNVDGAGKTYNDPWQEEMLEAIQDLWRIHNGQPPKFNIEGKNRFTMRSGHGPGKTIFLAEVAHYLGFTRQCQIICIGPKEKSILTRLWPRFRALYSGAIAQYRELMDISATKIRWCNDDNWVMLPETASDPESLAGFHTNGPNDWLVVMVDEASGLREDFWPVIYGMLTRPNTMLITIGNPTQTEGEFYRSHTHHKVAPLYYARHIRLEDSRYIDRKWAQQIADQYGADSQVYKVRVLGEFAEAGENQLIVLAWLYAARQREFKSDGSHHTIRVSLDVADGGIDETVATGSEIYDSVTRIRKVKRASFPPAESPVLAADMAEQMFKDLGGRKDRDDFVVDANGVGSGAAGTLIMRGYRVVLYRGGENSDNPDLWRNRRVQTHLVARNALRDGWVTIDDDAFESEQDWDDFCAQATAVRRKPGTEKYEDIETKQDLLKRTLKSPDIEESVFMTFTSKAPQLAPTAPGVARIVTRSEALQDDAYLT